MKFHHIGIATEDISKTEAWLKCIYGVGEKSDTVYDEKQDANLCMYTLEDGTKIELISGNVVKTFLKKKIFLYHTCYEVDNLDVKSQELLQAGAMIVSEPKDAVLFDNKRVMFFLTPMGMIELLERGK